MDLQSDLYLAAGLGAVGLGVGTVLREPGRLRNRIFALLCGCLAAWNLAKVGELTTSAPPLAWSPLYLLGGCASAPVGLHFALVIAGRTPAGALRPHLVASYAAAAALWISSWWWYDRQPQWNLAALVVLGAILLFGMVVLVPHLRSLPRGLERSAARLLGAGAAAAVILGLSDLLPRDAGGLLKVGPIGVLFLLLTVCAVLVRHHFLDVDVFLARALALLVGAAVASGVIYLVARPRGERLLAVFLTTLALIAIAGPVGKALMTHARGLLAPGDPLARALAGVSRRLTMARDPGEFQQALEEGRRALPPEVRVSVYMRAGRQRPFHLAFRSDPGPDPDPLREVDGGALEELLEREGLPLTRRFLAVEARETSPERRRLAASALERVDSLHAELLVPLTRGGALIGWMALGGGEPERYLTAESAAALLAVGNQAMASLERIEAAEAAKRREALAAVGEMAAGLAHEVRNPLGAIRGAAQVLASGAGQAQARDMLEVIQQESGRLGRVVGEFLDYARPASPRRESVDLGDLVRRVARGAEVAGQGLRVTVSVAAGAPPALGDPDQLQRAFGNLVQNARDAAGVQGTLRVEVAPDGVGRVAARFEDNGPGIPLDQLSRLFQPFHTTKAGGTGLGLALVHRVIEAHGGEVRVEGRPGVGAAFTIVLPAAVVAAAEGSR